MNFKKDKNLCNFPLYGVSYFPVLANKKNVPPAARGSFWKNRPWTVKHHKNFLLICVICVICGSIFLVAALGRVAYLRG